VGRDREYFQSERSHLIANAGYIPMALDAINTRTRHVNHFKLERRVSGKMNRSTWFRSTGG